MEKSVRVLNFDNSLIGQERVLAEYHPQIIDLKDLEDCARLWMGRSTREKILARLKNSPKNSITFLGSGDFHHLSEALLSNFTQPLTLIVFDFHPDWDCLPPRFGCGSWVSRALKFNNIRKCFLIGPSSVDLSGVFIHSADLGSLKDNRVEIYPYSHQPTRVFLRKVPQNISVNSQRSFFSSKIYWSGLKDRNFAEFTRSLLERVPTKQCYISIDKDCLKNEYSLTNWEEGHFSLEELLGMLKVIKENLDIIGVDITGDYSPIPHANPIKSFFSRLDHPHDILASKLSASEITAVNESTNLKILQLLTA